MTVVETLRDLLEKATPGPWETERDGGPVDFDVCAGRAIVCRAYGPEENPDKKAEHNAALIVVLCNAAPALLRVAEAARSVYEEDDFITVARDGDGRHERDRELGEALAALVRA